MAVEPAKVVRFAPPDIGDDEINEVLATLRSGWLSTGPRVHAFEQAFAEYVGVPHAVALNSCTAALHLSMLAAGVGPGDEVVTTPLTFCATANVVVHVGATPRFADIDPISWNLDPAAAAAAVTPRTRAVLPVHYAGRPAAVPAFRQLAARHGLTLIEDAAHCVEGRSGGARIGATADLTCFSFYATKNLTTGEGGMLTTASDEWASMARVASLHGMDRGAWARQAPQRSPQYDVVMPGYKYNMMDIQAAIGIHQLAGLETRWARREALWRLYDELLDDLPVTRPAPVAAGDRHARHLYTILVDPESGWSRDALMAALLADGIQTSVHFLAVHLHSFYAQKFGLTRGMFPVAEMVSDRTLSLPFSSGMRDDEVAIVADAIRRALRRRR